MPLFRAPGTSTDPPIHDDLPAFQANNLKQLRISYHSDNDLMYQLLCVDCNNGIWIFNQEFIPEGVLIQKVNVIDHVCFRDLGKGLLIN